MKALIIGLAAGALAVIIAGVKIIGGDVAALRRTRKKPVQKIESVYSIGDALEAKRPGTVAEIRKRTGGKKVSG
ncbi:MAG: hypothetical protein ACYCX4_14805 [Bacillota bacterium]